MNSSLWFEKDYALRLAVAPAPPEHEYPPTPERSKILAKIPNPANSEDTGKFDGTLPQTDRFYRRDRRRNWGCAWEIRPLVIEATHVLPVKELVPGSTDGPGAGIGTR